MSEHYVNCFSFFWVKVMFCFQNSAILKPPQLKQGICLQITFVGQVSPKSSLLEKKKIKCLKQKKLGFLNLTAEEISCLWTAIKLNRDYSSG